MRGLKSVDCATHLFRALDAMQLIERGFVVASCSGLTHTGGRSYVRAWRVAGIVNRIGQRVQNGDERTKRHRPGLLRTDQPHANVGEPEGAASTAAKPGIMRSRARAARRLARASAWPLIYPTRAGCE